MKGRKNRHVKSRAAKWKHRKSRPLRPLSKRHHRRYQYLYRLSQQQNAKTKFFGVMYGKNYGKSVFVGNTWHSTTKWGSPSPLAAPPMVVKSYAAQLASIQAALGTAFKQMAVSIQLSAQQMQTALRAFAEAKEEMEPLEPPGSSPDIAGSVSGYRCFNVDSGRGPVLGSLFQSYEWVPGVNVAMTCAEQEFPVPVATDKGDPHPTPYCYCGFWAMNNWNMLPEVPTLELWDRQPIEITTFGDMERQWLWPPPSSPDPRYQGVVVARVEGWGVVVEAELGWRAEKAKVVEIFGPPGGNALTTLLGEAYEVPVSAVDIYR